MDSDKEASNDQEESDQDVSEVDTPTTPTTSTHTASISVDEQQNPAIDDPSASGTDQSPGAMIKHRAWNHQPSGTPVRNTKQKLSSYISGPSQLVGMSPIRTKMHQQNEEGDQDLEDGENSTAGEIYDVSKSSSAAIDCEMADNN